MVVQGTQTGSGSAGERNEEGEVSKGRGQKRERRELDEDQRGQREDTVEHGKTDRPERRNR